MTEDLQIFLIGHVARSFSHGQPVPGQPPAPKLVNHYGKWVISEEPVTGVLGFNHAPEWVYDEINNGIELKCLGCKLKYTKHGCDYCEGQGDVLIGAWKRVRENHRLVYAADKTGDYAAIVRESVIQVVYSKTTKRGALCSPCFPGQVDLDTPGDFLGYCLPD